MAARTRGGGGDKQETWSNRPFALQPHWLRKRCGGYVLPIGELLLGKLVQRSCKRGKDDIISFQVLTSINDRRTSFSRRQTRQPRQRPPRERRHYFR